MTVNFKKRFLTSISLLLLIFLFLSSDFVLIYSLIVLGVLSIIEFLNLSKKIFDNRFFLFLANFSFIFYIFIFCFLFIFFSNFIQLKTVLILLIIICAASDIGGFIFGKIFKGPKLTKISPNKTISGSLGSIFLSILVMFIFEYFLTKNISFNLILVAVITSVFCQLGDLVFSYLKRKAKIKDTGNFLPGHGGILDRVDGILLGFPIGFISLMLLLK